MWAVVHAADVPAGFHATRDARSKLYRYTIHNSRRRPVPQFATRYCWHMWHELDLERMRSAATAFVGRHDFAAFQNQGSARETTVRSILRVNVQRRYDQVLIDVEGDGFLYNQVRNMVGTLVEIGRGHWPPERVHEALETPDRRLAGPTAPPQGLCLQWVRYEPAGSVTSGA